MTRAQSLDLAIAAVRVRLARLIDGSVPAGSYESALLAEEIRADLRLVRDLAVPMTRAASEVRP